MKPNIILIYADDLGYGDVSCYNPDSKISTPNIDRLAEEGIRFADAHAPDTVCSPSRYGILTGQYSWRTDRKSGNPPPGTQPWIKKGRVALPEMLQQKGYTTAVFGKWGLGADWNSAAKPGREGLDTSPRGIDYTKPIFAGKDFGFSHEEVHLWYGKEVHQTTYPCHSDPNAYEKVDGGRWYFVNGMSRGGDPNFSAFDMEEAQMHYIERTVDWIKSNDSPFFIYYAPHIPHWPHVPAKQFHGVTSLGYYGDFVAQLDWAVGQIVDALESSDELENTVIIFCSDNGPEVQTYDYHKLGHASSGDWRGVKRDAWEGGHRTPFIIRWPEISNPGSVTDRLVCQTDIYATVADLLDVSLSKDCAEDSFSFLDELLPEHCVKEQRELAIYHTGFSNKLAIRKGDWVLIDDPSGDNGEQEPEWLCRERGVVPHELGVELFDLNSDMQQTTNLAVEHPEIVENLLRHLRKAVQAGRTRKCVIN
ncbi:arylsulfatase [Puniceicoccales bacterium CK1056]|uniref:Arylsulfatase n=1 Tax=Oceanipulchritudo coccoides TaxID=2706888 RepID=A0A6B2M064_9BACT|nr:arylsulfatase [Oceanipulchritudo coccoides]NDV61726.1 arylsulfatase [Oceanipulchritudo coccoides]